MLLGLGLAFVVGSLASFVLVALLEGGATARRTYSAGFPLASATTAGSLSGLLAACAPGLDPDVAVLVSLLIGYLAFRVADERVNGRPRVFGADEVVVVPSQWRDDLV